MTITWPAHAHTDHKSQLNPAILWIGKGFQLDREVIIQKIYKISGVGAPSMDWLPFLATSIRSVIRQPVFIKIFQKHES